MSGLKRLLVADATVSSIKKPAMNSLINMDTANSVSKGMEKQSLTKGAIGK